MKNLKNKNKIELTFSVFLTAALLFFLVGIFYVNLNSNPSHYHDDMYCDLKYAKTVWQSKSIFPQNWVFGNQLYVIATPVLAALFYGMTSNIYLAMGIASCFMSILIVLSFCWMLKPLYTYNQRICAFLIMATLVHLQGSLTMSTCGAQLLFTMASYYACYLITAFVVYGCYIRIILKKKDYPMIVIAVLMSFATGIQSLRQMAIMVLPLVACEIFNIILNSIKKKKFIVTVSFAFAMLISVANICGIIVAKMLNVPQNQIYEATEGSFSFGNLISELISGFKEMLTFVTSNFGSFNVIGYLFGAFAAAMIFLGFIKLIKSGFENKADFFLLFLFALGCLSVLAIKVFRIIQVRSIYYFMLYPLLAVSGAYFLKNIKTFQKIGYSILVIICVALSGYHLKDEIDNTRNKVYVSEQSFEVANYLMENNYKCIFAPPGPIMDLSIASKDKINIVFITDRELAKKTNAKVFTQTSYLCIKDEYKQYQSEQIIYYIEKDEAEFTFDEVKKMGITAEIVMTLDNGDMLCKMSNNLCAVAAGQ